VRKPFWAGLILAVILYLAPAPFEGPNDVAADTLVSAAAQPRPPTSLTLVDRHGAEVTLNIDENTEVLVLGTWCVYSRRLNDILSDRLAKRYTDSKRLVYVLDYNELAHRTAPRIRSGEVSQAQWDAYVKSQPRGALLVDQTFLRHTAAREVLYFDDEHPIEYDAVPTAFSAPPNRFDLNHGTWLVRNLGMSSTVKNKLFELHPVEGEG